MIEYRSREQTAVDPVCGMKVPRSKRSLATIYNGVTFYFCEERCKQYFESNPKRFLKPRGLMGRFLARLAESNKKAFGSHGPPSCCP